MTDVTVEEFTIDELAARTGTTVRTIRFYSENGLLPAAERRGRMAYYGTAHRIRLELVQQLQQHGYTLAAISKVLERLPPDASAADLAVRASLLTPWNPPEPETLDMAGLEQRAGRSLDSGAIELLTTIGAVHPIGDGRFSVRPALLGAASSLIDTELPLGTLGRMAAIVDRHGETLAFELVDLVFGELREAKDPQVFLKRMAALLPHLRPLTMQVTAERFTSAIDRALQQRITELTSQAPTSG
jgi:DNA-binding transcriptional MerR regulator